MLGLTAAAMAQSAGAAHVIGCDVGEGRLALARSCGVTRAVNVAAGQDVARIARELTAGRGADLAVELSGAAVAIEQGVNVLRVGGRYVLVGSVSPSRDVAVNPEVIVRRMLTIRGVHNYGPAELRAAVRFLAEHHRDYPFERLVGSTWPLADAERAFAHAVASQSLRVAVRPDAKPRAAAPAVGHSAVV